MTIVIAGSLIGAACGSDSDSADDAAAAADVEVEEAAATPDDEDHDDEDHEDHDDEDHEDHDDEDHDDHDDEDHDDHDDEDHDDHDDEDHDDHDDEHDHDDESGGLGAHEHGTAEMSVAWIGSEVAIDLVSPNFNVFGFEYEPTSDEDLAIESDRLDALTAPGVIAFTDDAACALADPASTEIEREGSHSEITVSWLFDCENADRIGEVDVSALFDEFAAFEDVDVQWISDSQQSSAELSPSATAFTLQR